MPKRFLVFLIAAVLILTPLCGAFSVSAEHAFNFPTNIMYGGTSADFGDLIYYSAGGELRVREIGSDSYSTVLKMDARCINIDGGFIYFLHGDGIYRCTLDGGNITLLYSGSDMSCLYVEDYYIYYMSGSSVYRLAYGRPLKVFTQEKMQFFIPVSTYNFNWYASNPDFVQHDSGYYELSGETEDDKYIGYSFSAVTGQNASLTSSDGSEEEEKHDYSGPYVKVGDVTLPLEKHMPGTYFTKDGLACTCHGNPYVDHVASLEDCNCMRYYPTGVRETCEVDLLGAQCFAFSRLVFYKCFGFIDHQQINEDLITNLGGLNAGDVTANTCRELLTKACSGAHIRLRREHSMSVLTMDEDSITVYHANAGGDGVVSSPCVVSTRRLTWEEFADNWAYRGIAYVNVPKSFAGDITVTERTYDVGVYRVKTSSLTALNIRSEPNTSSEILGRYGAGQYVTVNAVEGAWGKTDLGWISLVYCNFITSVTLSPSENSIFSVEGDFLVARGDRASFDEFCQSLYNQNACGYSVSGAPLAESDYLTTGCSVGLIYDGNELSKKTVIVLGDINCNGIVDIADYVAAKRIIIGTYDADEMQSAAADIDRGGEINALDYIRIGRYLRTGRYS